MAKQFGAFDDGHRAFIDEQAVFFVTSCAPAARLNLSPKGMDSLRVLGPNRLIWLNLTGSGNETAAHLPLDPRMTIMWCGFQLRPLILRAYGTARVVHHSDPAWPVVARELPAIHGARQIIDMTVDLVQTSCGYAVPMMGEARERPILRDWAEQSGPLGLTRYWSERNTRSLDGLPTGIEANLCIPE